MSCILQYKRQPEAGQGRPAGGQQPARASLFDAVAKRQDGTLLTRIEGP